MIVGIYEVNPPFPPQSGAARYELHGGYVDATAAPDQTEAFLKLDLMKHANLKRLQHQQQGFQFQGAFVPGDENALSMMTAGAVALGDDETVPYVINGIDYGDFSGQIVRAMLGAFKDHVKQGFVTLRTVHAGILSGAITSRGQVDAAWQ